MESQRCAALPCRHDITWYSACYHAKNRRSQLPAWFACCRMPCGVPISQTLSLSFAGRLQPRQSVEPCAGSLLQTLVHRLSWYYAINGVNILLLIARILKLMDFQPRLGVVTRSLALAGPDLIHFVLVCGMVFIGYAMMAHLIFGNTIEVGTSCACQCLLFLRLFLQSRPAGRASWSRTGHAPRSHSLGSGTAAKWLAHHSQVVFGATPCCGGQHLWVLYAQSDVRSIAALPAHT